VSLPPLAAALIDANDQPTLLIERGRIRAANASAKNLLGAGIEGRDVRLAIRHPQALELILGPTRQHGGVEVTGIGGADQSWQVTVQPLPNTGDLSLVRLVNQSNLRAAEKMRVDFVANASHELRTPLATISGYAETLADDEPLDEATRRQFGATIRNESARMLRLIEQLMGLSRIEADRFRIPSESVDLVAIARLAIDECGEFAKRRHASVSIAADPDIPPVRGDSTQLLQVVSNLVVNALRYGCTADGCPIMVQLRRQDGEVTITVRDEGEGIAAEHIPRLTERFYRVDAARTRDQGGTGLGLAIVKHIVERHRGRLDIRSVPGRGTEVSVTLPID
jgi:two-component system phosphate regulon sensor histidine kinase PhoR